MTEQYVSAKVKEALTISEGDKHAAQKLLVTWAVRDPTLLLGIVKPHLKALVSAHLDHALRPKKKAEEKQTSFSKRELDAIVLAKPMGEKRSAPVVPPPKSSQRQASAIHQLVAAFKKRRSETIFIVNAVSVGMAYKGLRIAKPFWHGRVAAE